MEEEEEQEEQEEEKEVTECSTWYQTSGTLVYMGREATGPLCRVGISIFIERIPTRYDTKHTKRFWPSAVGNSEGHRVTGHARELESDRGNAKLARKL